jgi:hypothetical protein
LQDLGLDTLELSFTFQQWLQAGRVLIPQRLPERKRLLGGLVFALACRMRFAGVSARELGVQVGDRFAQHFGDSGAFPGRELGLRQAFELPADGLVMLGNVGQRQRAQPTCATIGIGKGQRRRLRAGLSERELVGHRLSVHPGSPPPPGSSASCEPCLGVPPVL